MADLVNKILIDLKIEANVDIDVDLDGVDNLAHMLKVPISASLSPNTVPPASKVWGPVTIALVAGASTFDLQALVRGSNLPNVNMDTQKIQAFAISCPAGNSGNTTFKPDATTGYNLFGGSTEQIILTPGAGCAFSYPDNLADVSGTVKDVDVTGTGTDSFTILIVSG